MQLTTYQGISKVVLGVISFPSLQSRLLTLVMTQATPKALRKVTEATSQDATLQEVMRLISSGHWDNLKPADGVDTSILRIFANLSGWQDCAWWKSHCDTWCPSEGCG